MKKRVSEAAFAAAYRVAYEASGGRKTPAEVKALILRDLEVVDDEGGAIAPEDLDVTIEFNVPPEDLGGGDGEEMAMDEDEEIQRAVRRELGRVGSGKPRSAKSVSRPITVRDRIEDDPRLGFKSLGEMAAHIPKFVQGRMHGVDERIVKGLGIVSGRKAATSWQGVNVGADGGFLVPPDFSNTILRYVEDEVAFLNLGVEGFNAPSGFDTTTNFTLNGNVLQVPTYEEIMWDDDTGLTPARVNEGGVKPTRKIQFKRPELRLNKLASLVNASDELLEDYAGLESLLTVLGGKKLGYKVNEKLFRGNGSGEALGVLNASAMVTAAQGVEDSTTLKTSDITSMYSRMYGPWRSGAVWLYNQSLEPQLMALREGDFPVWMPNNNISGSPFNTILGRPAFSSIYCSSANTLGDIVFVNWSFMLSATKASGINAASSIHLYFDQNLVTFRVEMRYDAQPWVTEPVTHPNQSGFTMSPFVQLAVRADNT